MKRLIRSHKRGTTRSDDRLVPVDPRVTQRVIKEISSLSSGSFRIEYLKKVFLSKFVSDETDPSDVRRQRAINKWLSAERDNEATEDRLIATSGMYHILPGVTLSSFLSYVRGLIIDIIGDTVPEGIFFGGYSGGASTTRSRAFSFPARKYLGQVGITVGAYNWVSTLFECCPMWAEHMDKLEFVFTDSNQMFTVPKTTSIDRVAAKEPDLNMYLQKGVGNYIRKQLKRHGIDLNDQSRNRQLARKGSMDGSVATLDLSSASDSVTCELVSMLLPPMWYSTLMDLRSPFTMIGSEKHRNIMISSMGNGFTFELESLLFYSISRAVGHYCGSRSDISVYGDDIIVPVGIAEYLISVLRFFGFQTNDEKSFTSGPFRESCGGHYWNGIDISPFYLRAPLKTIKDVITLCNHIRKWSDPVSLGICDPSLEELWLYLSSIVPQVLKGGVNLEDHTRLVSADRPHSRLQAVLDTSSDISELSRYLYWLDTCGTREMPSDGFAVRESRDTGTFRIRRHPIVGKPSSLFLTEVYSDPSGG